MSKYYSSIFTPGLPDSYGRYLFQIKHVEVVTGFYDCKQGNNNLTIKIINGDDEKLEQFTYYRKADCQTLCARQKWIWINQRYE